MAEKTERQEWENRAKHKFQHVYYDKDTNSVYIYFNGFADSHEGPEEIHGEFVVILPAKEYKRMRDYFLAHEEAPLL